MNTKLSVALVIISLLFFLQNGAIVFAQTSCQNWVYENNLGGNLKNDPSIIAASDRLIITAAGSDNAVWAAEYSTNGTIVPWYSIGGVVLSPTKMISTSGGISVKVVGSDNYVWERVFTASKMWTDWAKTSETSLSAFGPSEIAFAGHLYRAIRKPDGSVGIDKCGNCSAGEVNGCRVCKPDGSGWMDDDSRCARGQFCQSGVCFIPEAPLSKDLFGYELSAGANVMGSNSLDSYGHHCWIPNSEENDIIMQSAKKMHLRILRLPTLAQLADNTDCWGIANIKRFLDSAQLYGLKVIVELDGYTKYEGYCDWKAGFVDVRSGAAKIVTALKGHPALFAWDLINEPLWGADNSGCTSAADHDSVIKAVYSMHGLVRSIDPQTPLTVGEGKDEYLNIWNRITNFASPHIYSSSAPGAELAQVQNRLSTLKNIAGSLPLVIGEFGVAVPPLTESDRTQQFRGIYQTLKSADIGGIFWLLSPETGDNMEDFSLINSNGIFKDAGNAVMQSLPSYNGARFISQSVPASMATGKTYPISITLGNTGTDNWSETAKYRLGSQNPQDGGIWRDGRIYLASDESISPGQAKTFTFDVKAPATPGIYNFQWQMVQEGVTWFGDKSTNVAVTVGAPTACDAKNCATLGNYQCGSWFDSCGNALNCGSCAGGKTCNSNGQCVSSGGGGGGGGGTVEPEKRQIQEPLTRAEILQKIAEIKKLLIQLIAQLIVELQKQLLAKK